MSNVWYDMMVDRCIDQVDELSDLEVLKLVPDYVMDRERSDVNVNMDDAIAILRSTS